MEFVSRPTPPDSWIALVFSAQAVAKGGVVRRSRHWVEREIGMERFVAEVRRRGFHMVECGGQLIVICNPHGLRVIC
ncbi:N-(5'-phosphoribosyl)anthranilate isomerase [Rhodovulum sp. MB263]|uniref:N-(5'-phosphoribosyl)anthranilate isomerase n=1 Tax=Rhodovulum sp. (strain MB263) TaxID=308754 RepID=UPI0009B76136|nr:N-(5'-phosphoribosyl)anthranilate isomerase [Rhodovulum sp. MB263]ARC88408.1 N-(5'-phosphoribosyl)anthranilate isomerase [Rhodovulum sp. MB263]